MRLKAKYLMLLLLLPVLAAQGQSVDTAAAGKPLNPQFIRHVIKTNPLPILWASIPFTSEFRYVQEVPIARYQSLQLGFSYIGKSVILTLIENASRHKNEPRVVVSGFRIQFSHRYYFTELEYAPVGFYIGPHISYSTAKFSTRYGMIFNNYLQGTHYNINLIGGVQLLADDFTVDVFGGLGYKKNTWVSHSANNVISMDLTDSRLYNSPVKITLGFNIGMAFE